MAEIEIHDVDIVPQPVPSGVGLSRQNAELVPNTRAVW
jgi:hypothetical protein